MFEKEPTIGHVVVVGFLVATIVFLVLPADYLGGDFFTKEAAICIPGYAFFAILGSGIGTRNKKAIRSKWRGLFWGAAIGAIIGNFAPSILYVLSGGQ